MDAPDHVEYRRITQSWFTQRSLHALQDRIRVVARDCLDRMAGRGGECEFVRDIARPFPLRVMMSILALPKEDAPHVLALRTGIRKLICAERHTLLAAVTSHRVRATV
jgi:cytochrome P450